jgi:hypothetical protein
MGLIGWWVAVPSVVAIVFVTGAARARHRNSHQRWRLSFLAASLLLSVSPFASADPAPEGRLHCAVSTQEQARSLADSLLEQGLYQPAAECYEAAGEYDLANRAFLKAVGPRSAATTRKVSDQQDQAQALLHKVQSAFRSGH